MSLKVFGDDGDGEDLIDLAARYNYQLCSDDKWREDMSEDGMTDEEMWEYIESRREDG